MIKNNKISIPLFFLLVLVIKFVLFLLLKNDLYFSSTFVDEWWILEHLDGRNLSLYVYSPGYILFLKFFSLIFPATKTSIQIFQVIFSSVINTLIFLFLIKITRQSKAFVLALIPLFFAPVAIFSLRILPVAIWPELLILSIVLLFISINTSNRKYYYVGSSLLALASFMRPNLLLLIPVVTVLFFFIWKKSLKVFAPLVLTVLIMLAVGFMNYSETGEFIPLTANGGVNFYMGNNEFSDGVYMPVEGVRDEIGLQLQDSVRIYAENTGDNEPAMSSASSWWYVKGLDFIVQKPGKAAMLYLKKAALMFRNEEHSSSFSSDLIMESFFLPFFGFSLLLGVFAFFTIMSFRALNKYEKLFMSFFVLFSFAGVVSFIIDSRYRLGFSVTILTFTMLLAAGSDFKKILENRSKFTAAIIVAVIIFSITIFPKQKGNLYYGWYSLGNLYVEKEDWEEALNSFSNAVKDNPDYSHAWNNLGMTYLMLKDNENAQKAFEKAVEINPENPMFRENLNRSKKN